MRTISARVAAIFVALVVALSLAGTVPASAATSHPTKTNTTLSAQATRHTDKGKGSKARVRQVKKRHGANARVRKAHQAHGANPPARVRGQHGQSATTSTKPNQGATKTAGKHNGKKHQAPSGCSVTMPRADRGFTAAGTATQFTVVVKHCSQPQVITVLQHFYDGPVYVAGSCALHKGECGNYPKGSYVIKLTNGQHVLTSAAPKGYCMQTDVYTPGHHLIGSVHGPQNCKVNHPGGSTGGGKKHHHHHGGSTTSTSTSTGTTSTTTAATLPFTGSNVMPMIAWAIALIAAGCALLVPRRLRLLDRFVGRLVLRLVRLVRPAAAQVQYI